MTNLIEFNSSASTCSTDNAAMSADVKKALVRHRLCLTHLKFHFNDEVKQEIKEREHIFALLPQETRKAKAQKASSRAQLLKLCQQVDIDSHLAEDKHQRLEDELSCFRMPHPMADILPDRSFVHGW